MDRINEVTRMSREQMTSKVGQRYWALYASFYEKLFQKIDLLSDLKDAYNSRMKSGELTGEAKDAMTFFYRIRRDELDDPKFWNSVRENKKEIMIKINEARNAVIDTPIVLNEPTYSGGYTSNNSGDYETNVNYVAESLNEWNENSNT